MAVIVDDSSLIGPSSPVTLLIPFPATFLSLVLPATRRLGMIRYEWRTNDRRDTVGPNQLCSLTGSLAGANQVTGSVYMEAAFGYTKSHIWRNVHNFANLINCR